MTPAKPLYIHTVTAEQDDGKIFKSSFLAISETNALTRFRTFNKLTDCDIKVTVPLCNGQKITELHCLRYGTKFQSVHKGSRNNDDTHDVKSPVLTKYDYNSINRTYLCIDADGYKHYIDAYEWCITKEEK